MLNAATHRSQGHFHAKKLEDDSEDVKVGDNLEHIEEIIDKFIAFADLNNDGLINYGEYVKALVKPMDE
jgi:hypothetical protein